MSAPWKMFVRNGCMQYAPANGIANFGVISATVKIISAISANHHKNQRSKSFLIGVLPPKIGVISP
jgi:hypothetical protein